MKTFAAITLLLYWSVIILAPVIAKERLINSQKTIYPEKKQLFLDIAKECDLTRVKAGLHYPSDGKFSKQFVDFFFNNNQKD